MLHIIIREKLTARKFMVQNLRLNVGRKVEMDAIRRKTEFLRALEIIRNRRLPAVNKRNYLVLKLSVFPC